MCKEDRIKEAREILQIISERLEDAKLSDQKGVVLYLDDGHVFDLEIVKELTRYELFNSLWDQGNQFVYGGKEI